jgi:hypothetical protein
MLRAAVRGFLSGCYIALGICAAVVLIVLAIAVALHG